MTSGLHGLRVLAFCDYLSLQSSGGSERAAIEVYRRLAGWGATVKVITTMPGSMPPVVLEGVAIDPIPSLDLTAALRLQVGLAPALFLRLRSFAAWHPDVLHAHTLFFQTSLAAALLQTRTRTPMVTTVQIAGLEMMSEPARSASRAYEATVGRFILSRSARILAVSPSVQTHVLSLGTKPDRVTVIPNGVDLDRFQPRASGPLPDQTPVIAFVGRLIENKGPEVLLEALLRLHADGVPFRAVYFGEGPMRRQLESRARAAGAPISFTGHVPDPENRLPDAHLVVRPSLTEGLPLAILEAMACGVCVVASDIPGNRDLIEDERNGVLVRSRDPRQLAVAILGLLKDPVRRRRLGAAGRKTAERYSWDATARATAEVLLEAAGMAGVREAA